MTAAHAHIHTHSHKSMPLSRCVWVSARLCVCVLVRECESVCLCGCVCGLYPPSLQFASFIAIMGANGFYSDRRWELLFFFFESQRKVIERHRTHNRNHPIDLSIISEPPFSRKLITQTYCHILEGSLTMCVKLAIGLHLLSVVFLCYSPQTSISTTVLIISSSVFLGFKLKYASLHHDMCAGSKNLHMGCCLHRQVLATHAHTHTHILQ